MNNMIANTKQQPTMTIYCVRSGLPIATVTATCSNGWPLLNSFQEAWVHPIYNFPLNKLLVRIKDQLIDSEAADWKSSDNELTELALSMSAIMYSLEAFHIPHQESKQQVPSLPNKAVVFGAADRLLKIASWYHYLTSKRIVFPLYSVSKLNKNTEWNNFSSWLDTVDELKTEWETKTRKHQSEEDRILTAAANKEVRSETIYKRLDFNKVWNWIESQCIATYSTGRLTTLKELFMKGDLNPSDWTVDDCDDLTEAVVTCCDLGNDISHFINTRVNGIREAIVEFYSSFTLINSVVGRNSAGSAGANSGAVHPDAVHTEQEALFFEGFDRRIDNLDELPAAPKRESFASLGLFLKAQAQHRILERRFLLRKTDSKTDSKTDITNNQASAL